MWKVGLITETGIERNCQWKSQTIQIGCSETRQGRNYLPTFGLGANVGNPNALPLKLFTGKLVWVEQWLITKKKKFMLLRNSDRTVRY